MFKRENKEDPFTAKARKRVDRLSSNEALDWADQAGSGIALALQDYRREASQESLAEAKQGLQALLVIVETLQERTS